MFNVFIQRFFFNEIYINHPATTAESCVSDMSQLESSYFPLKRIEEILRYNKIFQN